MAATSIKYVFLELTNYCNFNCTFCPNESMTRSRGVMDKDLACRIIDEVADQALTREPLQLHVMGEPFLNPHLFELIDRIHERGRSVRLFTNGALLNERNRERVYASRIEELTIGIHTDTTSLYHEHRRGKLPFEVYLRRIRETIEEKFRRNSPLRIFLQYLNTKHFNQSRLDKGYPARTFPLTDRHDKAIRIVEDWKSFGLGLAGKYRLDFKPRDLEGLQDPFREAPLDCLKGDHCEILPGVILGFKDISSFSDYLTKKVRFVERYKAACPAFDEQLAVLWDGRVTPCCVDYNGQLTVGDANVQSLESLWDSKTLGEFRDLSRNGFLPTPTCRVCKAFLVADDYQNKFPGCENEDYNLAWGWYPLEGDGNESFRWTGKRAVLEDISGGRILDVEVRNGHPILENLGFTVQQGGHKTTVVLEGHAWRAKIIQLSDRQSDDRRIIFEAGDFWIPSDIWKQNQDRRELGVMIKAVRIR